MERNTVRMKTGEAIVCFFEMDGIETAYGIPRTGINGLYNSLSKTIKINATPIGM